MTTSRCRRPVLLVSAERSALPAPKANPVNGGSPASGDPRAPQAAKVLVDPKASRATQASKANPDHADRKANPVRPARKASQAMTASMERCPLINRSLLASPPTASHTTGVAVRPVLPVKTEPTGAPDRRANLVRLARTEPLDLPAPKARPAKTARTVRRHEKLSTSS